MTLPFFDFEDLVISNETFTLDQNESMSVFGDILIEPGGELMLSPGSRLYMGPDAKIIVKDAGELSVIEGTITSACNQMWRGIEVWDVMPDNVMDLNGNLLIPGSVQLNNATIRNAHIGLLNGKTVNIDDPVAEFWNMPYFQGIESHSWGGKIHCTGSLFLDCGIGIYYPNHVTMFPQQINNNIITGTTFRTGHNGLPDERYNRFHFNPYPDKFAPYFGIANNQTRGHAGLVLAGVKGIELGIDDETNSVFEGNYFENLETGIRQIRSSVSVRYSSFDNLRYGIHLNHAGHFWSASIPTEFKGNTFNRISDPDPAILPTLPIPNITNNSNPFNPWEENSFKSRTAAMRIEGLKNFSLDQNTFGNEDITVSDVNTGIYLSNVEGFTVKENRFFYNESALVVWDCDPGDLDIGLVGKESSSDVFNIFENCAAPVRLGGDNRNLWLRCNRFDNGSNYSGGNWHNTGPLADQGFPGDAFTNQSAAGNAFNTIGNPTDASMRQILSLCLDCDEPWLDYAGWLYYHHLDNSVGQSLVPVAVNTQVGGNPVVSAFGLVNTGFPYHPLQSCDNPLGYWTGDGTSVTWIADKEDIADKWDAEKQVLTQKWSELDEFHSSTSSLLGAVYGGITNQYQLKEFLRLRSPLSPEVLQAYMANLDVPLDYLQEIISINGALDRELHAMVEERIENLPAAIQAQIMQLAAHNGLVTSWAAQKRKVRQLELVHGTMTLRAVNQSLVSGDVEGALLTLTLSNHPGAVWKRIAILLENGRTTEASVLINNLPSDDDESIRQKALATLALNLVSESRGLDVLSVSEIAMLRNLLTSDPTSESHTGALALWGGHAETPLYLPDVNPAPQPRRSRTSTGRKGHQVVAFPNPAQDYTLVEIALEPEKQYLLQIIENSGPTVRTETKVHTGAAILIELRDLANGAYMLRFTQDNRYWTLPLIKQ